MSSTKDRMKIDSLLNPSHRSASSSSSPCLYLLPSSNRPNRLLAPLEPNRELFETPIRLQGTFLRDASEAPHVHSSGQDTWSGKPCSGVSSASYVPRPTVSAERLRYACPLKGCREKFSGSRDLRTHYSKVHLISLKHEMLVKLNSNRGKEEKSRTAGSTDGDQQFHARH
ncbi:hypothetical protein BDV41DRAFT_576755 [Aspergillus transmontanensis]|uniref:C2H2-type domain-containing protein n=1 Tax=Aspergillus transmontanensis TaxID=1034304 RepID=A0A5N6VYY4_9EURO|nr:hypothetical protein BDV41DRAFT_576755 [Aspergillus transmontanensis]